MPLELSEIEAQVYEDLALLSLNGRDLITKDYYPLLCEEVSEAIQKLQRRLKDTFRDVQSKRVNRLISKGYRLIKTTSCMWLENGSSSLLVDDRGRCFHASRNTDTPLLKRQRDYLARERSRLVKESEEYAMVSGIMSLLDQLENETEQRPKGMK